MADLYDRLYPIDDDTPKISVHSFYAAIVDYTAGYTTRAQIIAVWSLESEAITDLDALLAALNGQPNLTAKLSFGAQLHAVMLIAETGHKYNTKAAFRTRLGI